MEKVVKQMPWDTQGLAEGKKSLQIVPRDL